MNNQILLLIPAAGFIYALYCGFMAMHYWKLANQFDKKDDLK